MALGFLCRHFRPVVAAFALFLLSVAPVAAAAENRIAAALDTLAIKSDGSLWGWGYNAQFQLGDGTATNQWSPVLIGTDYAAIAAGRVHTLAVKTDGSLWAWGWNSSIHGNLGTGGTTGKTVPFQIAAGGFVSVAAGNLTSFGIKTDASLWAWGRNDAGQLGDNTLVSKNVPVQVGSGFASVAAGYNIAGPSHTVAVKTDGSLWAWGYNQSGQVGDGSTTNRLSPVQIGGGFASVAAGSMHSVAVKSDGSLWAWGYNFAGQLGNGANTTQLTPVLIGTEFAQVSAGSSHTVAIKTDGTLWAWGANSYGQLGDGTVVGKNSPVLIGANFVSAAAGETHTVALKSDGTLWAWGRNDSGQLGGGTITDQLTPIQIGAGYAQATTTTTTAATTTTTTASATSTTTTQAATTTTSTTTTSASTTTTGATTTTTLGATTLNFVPGWNLVGNSVDAALDVAAKFGDANKVSTVWKWVAALGKWAFYTPLQGDGGAAYAAGKGYDFLSTVAGGEGVWVNARASFAVPLPTGTAVTSASFQGIASGWSLIAIGDNKTPSAFNIALNLSLPAAGEIPLNVTTLWAWDSSLGTWYFYAPSLEKNGTLSSYLQSKNYLDFGAKTLDPAMGFWVNRP